MNIAVNYHSGALQKAGWVRVGHNSSFTNQDAAWSFVITPGSGESVAKIDSVRWHFNWNNEAGGSGWQGAFTYIAKIRSGSPTGAVIASVQATLQGKSGNWDVQASNLNLAANTTYYITLNLNGSTLSSLKTFSTTATAEVLAWTSAANKCTAPTRILFNGKHTSAYASPGQGVQFEIVGGGGGKDNAFVRWHIQELVFKPGQGELTGWRNATNANEQENSAVYHQSSRFCTLYPTLIRGRNKRFRIRAEGAAGEQYYSDFAEVAPNVISNSPPNVCTNVTADKNIVAPGSTLRLSFTGGGDPDGNLWMYQVRAEDENGVAFTGKDLGRQYDVTKNYVDIDLGLVPEVFRAGTKWRFKVRGHDGCEACAWSAPSEFVQIAGIAHVYGTDGAPNKAMAYVYDQAGAPKLTTPYCYNANGAPELGI